MFINLDDIEDDMHESTVQDSVNEQLSDKGFMVDDEDEPVEISSENAPISIDVIDAYTKPEQNATEDTRISSPEPEFHDTPIETIDTFDEEPVPVNSLPESSLDTASITDEPDILTPEAAPLTIEATRIEEADNADAPLYDPTAELSKYVKPSIELLEERSDSGVNIDVEEQEANKQRIIKTLLDYGIPIADIKATVGPTITLFEIIPAEGVRIASIRRLEDDIARSLAAEGVRIVAPIPGRATVGIEVPNHTKHTVSMRSILSSKKYQECNMALPMAMGTTISNEVFVRDLAKIPHLLVAGATGQGKSVGLNAIITSLIYKRHPAELKFVLI
ncbi:MAG: DNA translocase FtsK, partial [Muribaculaceae bacterium]|nr:DNA translocase FtsK [Muribaculaceae bacterium]